MHAKRVGLRPTPGPARSSIYSSLESGTWLELCGAWWIDSDASFLDLEGIQYDYFLDIP